MRRQVGRARIPLISAKCILDAIDRSRFNPIVVGISRKGVWHLEEEKTFFTGEFRADKIKLNENAPTVTLTPFPAGQRRGRLEAAGRSVEFDVVFPIVHGQYGEDGTLQGLLDIMGVPYVGSGCGSSWICMDKVLTKTLCSQSDIRVADFTWVTSVDELSAKAARSGGSVIRFS